ncbi:hypothetical protein RchiOBHm_Chr3g0466791 [Rosa chinensis]|uniref:Uncharacterized protein n=1 Tax=Rosa chinensis TaxID=74649 RepID=A0A2P6RA26_ROSCH|nr:uncharacterized protein LOC112193781 [Rosa chinensis]PRQ43282.1 hypothetical protein RchiOBHm_Chr3g0466791 [Rosa chinensis]
MDDKDLDDAALWAVIDSAAASHSSKSKFQSRQPLAIQCQRPSPLISNPSPPQKLFQTARISYSGESDSKSEGEVVEEPWAFHPPRKIARSANDGNSLAVVRNVPRTPTTPVYASPETHLSPGIGRFSSPVSYPQREERDNNPVQMVQHSLSGMFPSVSLFKEYQDAAMAILEKTDYTKIHGSTYIKKSGWRKISFYFNLSFEIKDKSIEFDESRNVLRAEFVVRAHMQGGRFSDGWGSCDRREKRFNKPNHDIPSTAETRAKNKASSDLLGIGDYRPGASQDLQYA